VERLRSTMSAMLVLTHLLSMEMTSKLESWRLQSPDRRHVARLPSPPAEPTVGRAAARMTVSDQRKDKSKESQNMAAN